MAFLKAVTIYVVCFQLEFMTTATVPGVPAHRHDPGGPIVKRQSCNLYEKKIEALQCQEAFLEAVREEIEQSTCRNIYYIYEEDDDPFDHSESLCDGPRDAREDLRNCSKTCSARQKYYLSCTHLIQQYASIRDECYAVEEDRRCLFDKGDFCFLKGDISNSLLVDCYATSPLKSLECTETCRNAVKTYISKAGCCVDRWQYYSHYPGPSISDIFSACEVEIPEPCPFGIPPPNEFLDCARESVAAAAGAAEQVVPSGWMIANVGLLIMALLNIM